VVKSIMLTKQTFQIKQQKATTIYIFTYTLPSLSKAEGGGGGESDVDARTSALGLGAVHAEGNAQLAFSQDLPRGHAPDEHRLLGPGRVGGGNRHLRRLVGFQ
jgi:hypothetical protein